MWCYYQITLEETQILGSMMRCPDNDERTGEVSFDPSAKILEILLLY